jgi:hypothetical protein
MAQYYSDPSRETDPHSLPDLEVFYACEDELSVGDGSDDRNYPAGWYWWACFPGCMPDSDPMGPFDSLESALADAREGRF